MKYLKYLLILLTLISCKKKDYKAEKATEFSWDLAGITKIDLNAIKSNVVLKGEETDKFFAVLTNKCTDKDEGKAKANLDENYFLGEILSNKIYMHQQIGCASCDCSSNLEFTTPDSMAYDILTNSGRVTIWYMNANGNIENKNGGVYISNNQGSVNIEATESITVDYLEAEYGDSLIIHAKDYGVLISLPESTSAEIDCQTTNGAVDISGFNNIIMSVNQSNKKIGQFGNLVHKMYIKVLAEPTKGLSNIEIFDR